MPKCGVYFVQADAPLHLIKIGTSQDLRQRIYELRRINACTLTVLGVFEAGIANRYSRERECHTLFGAHRHHGEWFRPDPVLLEFIRANTVSLEDLPDLPETVRLAFEEFKKEHGLRTVDDAALFLGLSVTEVLRLTQQNQLISIRLGRHIRYTLHELQAAKKELQV